MANSLASLIVPLALFPALAISSAEPPAAPAPLMRLSLQDLRYVEVTSVSRKEESLITAPAAIYVIEQEDLRRSGVTSIPESLRMAPGINVARINGNKWAISSRGFNSRFANKQLVLMDGRALYTPVFSGVYWDAADTVMEDIDRIEVIRGPGGALWGANAVNGVINILTKDARDTQGTLLTLSGGTEETGSGALRHGGQLTENLHYRVYAKGFRRGDFRELNGVRGADEWWQQREGFRMDWAPLEDRHLTLQGDYYFGHSGDRVVMASPTAPYSLSRKENAKATGWNLLGRWSHTLSETADYTLQLYYDRKQRENLVLNAKLDTLDLDFQNKIQIGERNEFIWGAGYRLLVNDIAGSYSATYFPEERHDQLFSVFVQDELALVPDRLSFTAGSKFEHNDYTGWEVQPSGRLTFRITDAQTLWAAVSRAVRTPALFENDAVARVALPGSPTVIATIRGNPRFFSEELTAYELGHRVQVNQSLFFDSAAFYNSYDRIRTSERGPVIPGAPIQVPITYGNQLRGQTHGFELGPTWQVTDSWRLAAAYSFLSMDLDLRLPSTDRTAENAEGDSPENQFHLRSFLDLPHNFQLDSAVFYVDSLKNQKVPSYVRWDIRLGWSPRPNLDLSVAVQNILDSRHPEFGSTAPLVTPTEIERSVYGKVTWRF